MKEIPKAYEPQKFEEKLYENWESSGYFKPEINPDGDPFCIIMPPPNANGSLHIGHAVFVTLEDLMVRYARLLGKSALWLPGADHAGFETQVVFEKKLEKEGKSRFQIEREELYKMMYDFTQENKEVMENQLRKLGASCDWDREKFTLDEDIKKIVYRTFKKLYEDGLAYRSFRPVNWCTKHQTSLSDLEVKYEERKDPLYYIKYGPLTLATVRPETLFGDVAVAVSLKDKRYANLVEQKVKLPLTDREISIIADEHVDPKFGAGVVKITPAHDPNDFEVGKRHNLEAIEVIDQYGRMNEKAGSYKGLKIMEARAKVVEDLKKKGLIEKIDENYVHSVGVCYKCGSVIEPRVLPQWFIAVNKKGEKSGKTLAMDAMKAVKEKKTEFVTEKFEKIFNHWMKNIRDWNISRQIVWGIQIPVWYRKDDNSKIHVDENAPSDIENWEQDPDVFDTWFSSGQWPFASLMTTQKRMGFASDIVPQVLDGKTSTWRLRDHGIRIGDQILLEDSSTGNTFGSAIISDVRKTIVGEIDLHDKNHYKTYENIDELIAAFKRHNPEKEVNLKTQVWVYTYEFRKEFSSDFKKFYPTDVMETGWDILFFWVARMIMLGLYETGEVPFKKVYMHGLVRDKDRQKMSKSKDNVINPLGVAEQYGTDAVRMSLIFGTSAGNDAIISEEKIRGMRNFVNKVWNASRFVMLRVSSGDIQTGEIGEIKIDDLNIDEKLLTGPDKEILKKHEEIKKSIGKKLDEYRFSHAGEEIYDYFWHDFCDVYIEASKSQFEDDKLNANTKKILIKVLSETLIMLHPFVPFVTEAVWQELRNIYPKLSKSIMISRWPK
ncbi:MAG: class I tRNA ligase family protein [Patescibacteria group bacterium]|nr:class I tRNA ligase family protein [Patescibacteria group bacterium]